MVGKTFLLRRHFQVRNGGRQQVGGFEGGTQRDQIRFCLEGGLCQELFDGFEGRLNDDLQFGQ